MFGLAGSVLHVDLTELKTWKEVLPESETIRFGGGRGINAKLLWDNCPRSVDPLGPDNPLVFGVGALTGTTAPCTGRTTVTSKSPATGLYAKASGGGSWGANLKFAGYDHLVVHGAAETPTYVWIHDDHVEFLDAADLWGKTVTETNVRIASELSTVPIEVASIGPAGENLVRYASIMFGVGNAAARCGVGAVMGSKQLKAIAVCGTQGLTVADITACQVLGQELAALITGDPAAQELHCFGSLADIPSLVSADQLPAFNYRQGDIENIEQISGPGLKAAGFLEGPRSCYGCVIGCHIRSRIRSGRYRGTTTHGPQYETACSLGSLVGVTDASQVIKASALCNEYAMDTVSVGGVIAWVMECVERGVLSATELDGIDATWGNGESVIALIHAIARRHGVGDVLAEGVRSAAESVGGGSAEWAVEARGLEQSRLDVRWPKASALAFAVNPRGPDFVHAQPFAEMADYPAFVSLIEQITGDAKYHPAGQTAKRPEIVVWHEDYIAAMDNLGFCLFTYAILLPKHFALYLSAARGRHYSEDDVQLMGRRTVTAERLFNFREGYRRNLDTLPSRMLDEKRGSFALTRGELTAMLQRYYQLHGWNPETGAPTAEVVDALDLRDFASPDLRAPARGGSAVRQEGLLHAPNDNRWSREKAASDRRQRQRQGDA